MDLISLLQKKIAETKIVQPQERLVVAVSGGVDSMVLLDLLDRLRKPIKMKLVIAHLNHGMRGRQSEADARFVRREALKRNLPFELKSLRKGFLKGQGNVQERARQLRYEFLAKVAKKHGARKIVTAHHADDQMETFLMRLIRGSGAKGLKGMALSRLLPLAKTPLQLIRPLLFFTRDQIMAYAREEGLSWREDPSNQTEDYLRNRIRKRLVPEMKRLNPRLVEGVSRTLDSLQKEEEWIQGLLLKNLRPHVIRGKDRLGIALKWILAQAEAPRFRIYLWAFNELGLKGEGVYRVHLEALERMVRSKNKKARLSLPRGFGAYVSEKQLIFKKWSKIQPLNKRGFFY